MKIVLNTIIFLILIGVIFMLITSKIPLFGVRSFVVITGSMEPKLPVGSIIFTQPGNYQVGDIIAFTRDNMTITHRISMIQSKNNQIFYQVKGDANNAPDGDLVPNYQVLGESLFALPFLGRIVMFVKTIPGFIILIVIPTLALIFSESKNIKKEIEKEFEKKLLKKLEIEKKDD